MTFTNLFLFIVQIIVCILLIISVLLQSSDEDSLSGIGASATQANALSHKTSVDTITKVTIVLGVILMFNSFLLTSISTHRYNKENNKIKDYIENTKSQNESKTENN